VIIYSLTVYNNCEFLPNRHQETRRR